MGKVRQVKNSRFENEMGLAKMELHQKGPRSSPMLSYIVEGLTPTVSSLLYSWRWVFIIPAWAPLSNDSMQPTHEFFTDMRWLGNNICLFPNLISFYRKKKTVCIFFVEAEKVQLEQRANGSFWWDSKLSRLIAKLNAIIPSFNQTEGNCTQGSQGLLRRNMVVQW